MKVTTLAYLAAAVPWASAWFNSPQNVEKRHAEIASRLGHKHLHKRENTYTTPTNPHGKKLKHFNKKTSKYWVNGTAGAIPEVNFDVSENYAGLMPISDKKDESRELFFWFWPTTGGKEMEDDIVIWLNGGPGCSSMEGFLQENGPISWEAGTIAPVRNPYAWTNISNVIWIEQPVGTGFTRGKPNIHNQDELAEQFMGFWKQFMDHFSGLKGKRIWITGESYAGAYVPYITNAFYNANDTAYYNAHGLMINDPVLDMGFYLQGLAPVYPFAKQWKDVLALEDKTLESLKKIHEKCGFKQIWDDSFTYPPKGPITPSVELTLNETSGELSKPECNSALQFQREVLRKNPCFDVYKITNTCPTPYDQLGSLGPNPWLPPGSNSYFDRRDVQDAIHAPHINWTQCADQKKPVYVGGLDLSIGTNVKQLPECIEKSKRVVVANGDLDYIITSFGTLMAIQNMTWGGKQGFQKEPSKKIEVEFGEQGDMGTWTEERGLTWAQVKLSGHMLPGHQPGTGFKLLQYLLGRIDTLSATKEANSTEATGSGGY